MYLPITFSKVKYYNQFVFYLIVPPVWSHWCFYVCRILILLTPPSPFSERVSKALTHHTFWLRKHRYQYTYFFFIYPETTKDWLINDKYFRESVKTLLLSRQVRLSYESYHKSIQFCEKKKKNIDVKSPGPAFSVSLKIS